MKNSGIDLWRRAKELIPGGNQLLSKRSELFLPEQWPSYYKSAKGCEIWDLDNNSYYDFAQMGVGSCILGYADGDVNGAVVNAVENGSMATLNSYEEVELAQRLVDLHPWADMARFARTGGEACAVAIRIARAASGKDRVAFCGYHGWHDWYLAANIKDAESLDDQLLPGLDPKGVPRALGGSALPFHYNRLDELERIVEQYPGEVGVIIMEPVRGHDPLPEFIHGVREVADKTGAVLVFDEVTSGFRMNLGGIHLRYGVDPDVAVFGKALGNGFPISAVIGKRAVMDHAQESFISSTMWTERIGYAAALATLGKIQARNVPAHLVRCGERINEGWKKSAAENDVKIEISGIPPLTHIQFQYENPLALQTLYTQEMLKRGFLVGAAVYTTYAYTDEIMDLFSAHTGEVFGLMAEGIKSGRIDSLLEGPVRHSGFARLT
jgi:glutamate-1-semialdehyde 2,1-aminomutase